MEIRTMKVVHITARLSEGGAAAVARNLADELSSFDVQSEFIYGYGRRGSASHLESSYQSTRLGNPLVASVQLGSHRLLGQEIPLAKGGALHQAEKKISESDLVHIHIPHSYFLSLKWFVEIMLLSQKPFVWTLHDHWPLTGRCAQPGNCAKWKTGCGHCPNMGAYPPGLIDRSAKAHKERRNLLGELSQSNRGVWVPCAEWLRSDIDETNLAPVKVIQNSVDGTFWREAHGRRTDRPAPDTIPRVLFLCRDLRDEAKIDWHTLRRFAASDAVTLTVVGDNSPETLQGARHLPATTTRAELARVMLDHDVLLFTSTVDYFPLTIAEALVAGMAVVASDSPAAREFANLGTVRIYTTSEDAIDSATRAWPNDSIPYANQFAPGVMAERYLETYRDLLS
jgi:putative colanic acid biosynthesis glycosyltransferase